MVGKPPCWNADQAGQWLPPLLAAGMAGFEPRPLPDAGRRRAAVVLALTETGHGAGLEGLPQHGLWQTAPALLLTRRAAGLRSHAGQWALPGGRLNPGETAAAAAIRELHEELGLTLPADSILGWLDDYATRSGYVISAAVAWAGEARELKPDPAEVASVHRIPLAELMRSDAPWLDPPLTPPPGQTQAHPVLRMPIGQTWIAAPTAAFLYQLRELLQGRTTRVAHLDQPEFAWR
jgi:ADP-ribose pyrophosphatase YjhB (NUDIX family)